ncbi:hypothetical protein BDR26DRAFT_1010481 [Obelidium mucronatum]|nr:hypothetical protein BDR26DRAFT_1010481 [Obelidium mucronatum]
MASNSNNRKSVNRHSKFDFSQSAPTHFTSETEIAAYVNWINTQLAGDPDLSSLLPISTTRENAFFEACSDGVILCKLVNNSVPGTIPEKQVTKNAKTVIHKFENLQKALAGAVKIGVHVHNLSAEDIMKGTPHLVLGLVWQVIKVGLLQNINTSGTESANTSVNDIASKAIEPSTQTLEKALLKWVNGTLKKQNLQLRVTNFGADLSDSVALTYLIASFDDDHDGSNSHHKEAEKILQEPDLSKRAELVLQYAQKFDCRHFASATDIVGGNKNLNLAFVAVLHNLKVSREKTNKIRIQLEGAKDSAEAALLRVNSSKDVETKKLRLQLEDAREEAERLRAERDALQNDLDELRGQAEEQEQVYDENEALASKVFALEEELQQSRQVADQVSCCFESLTDSFSKVFQSKKEIGREAQNMYNRIVELQAELDYAHQQVKDLQESNKDLRHQLAELRQTNLSFQSLNDLSAPANSLNNLSNNNNNNNQEELAQQLAESQANAQNLQYKLLALQAEKDERDQELEQALQRAEQAEEQTQQSTESLAQIYAQTKKNHQKQQQQQQQQQPEQQTELQKKQQELVESIDTLNEEVLALQQMSKTDPDLREKLLQDQIRQMQTLTIQLVAHANLNEAEVVERVFHDLRKQDGGDLFQQLQLKDRSHRDLVSALAEFVAQLNRKACDNEKKVEQLSKSIDTLSGELQKKALSAEKQQEQQQQQQQQQQQEQAAEKSSSFRDADIDSVAAVDSKQSRKQIFSQLKDEKERLQDRLAVLHRTTAAIMEQRSLLISENNKLQNNESTESVNLSRQIHSLDNLLQENLKFRKELEDGNEDFFNSMANLEELAVQQVKVQQQVDAMVRSEDCLIDDLNNMKDTNQELQEKLENAQRCISALMAQRSILLKDRDELKEQLTVAKSQQSLSPSVQQSNEGLNRTKHNNSFASAPNLSSQQ